MVSALFLAPVLLAESGPPGAATEFEQMLVGFGKMETVGGKLLNGFPAGSDNCNDWLTSAEGGAATNADLSRPHMAQADAEGNIYIADKEGYAIRRISADGIITTIAGTGAFGNDGDGPATQIRIGAPNGLHTFPDGTTYLLELNDVCETGSILPGGRIRRVGTDGMLTMIVDDPDLVVGRGLWVSRDESLIYYCSGSVIRKWTPDGGIETYSSGYTSLGNIAMGPDGLLHVTDRSSRNLSTGHHAYRLSADGATRTVIAGNGSTAGGGNGLAATATGLNEIRGIAVRPDGSFFLCTHRASQVWFVDTEGLIWLTINGNRSSSVHGGDGEDLQNTTTLKISEPRAITLAPNGDLLITENDDGYIRRVTNICVHPEITHVARSGESTSLTWQSHRQASYTIESSENLLDWSLALEPATGPGTTTTVTLQSGDSRRFFRIVQQ